MGKTARNGIWLYFLQIINTVFPLLTVPYIVRILDSAQYGVFSLALNIVGYFQVFVEYGFGMSATREVALHDNAEYTSQLFSAVLIARLLILTLCAIVTSIFVCIMNVDQTQRNCLFILQFSLLGYALQINWLFQGKQDMKYISIASIVSRITTLSLIFVFVKTADDLYTYCFLYAVAPVISACIGIGLARNRYGLGFVWTSFGRICAELKDGWYVFTTALSSKIFGAIGITFLGIFATESVVGIYSAINKISNLIILGWSPLGQVLYPIVSRKMQQGFEAGYMYVNRIRRVILPIFACLTVCVAVFSKQIVVIAFGGEYAQYHYWLWPLMVWILVAINNNFLGIQMLLGSGRDKQYSKCFQIGVVCTVVLNLVLIKFFQGWGAALTPLLSELILGGMLMIIIKGIVCESEIEK